MWNWNVMDKKTRYILASHLSRYRTAKVAVETLEKAKAAAGGKEPNTITTDKLRSYGPAIKKVFPKTLHIKSQGIRSSLNNNLSERLQGTYRSREKTLRGMDSVPTGQRYLDGWTITYNLMRDHESLKGKTPAEAAKVESSFTEWADVVKGDTTPQLLPAQAAKTPKAELAQLKVDVPAKQSKPAKLGTPKVTGTPRSPVKMPKAEVRKPASPRKGRGKKLHPAVTIRNGMRCSLRKRGGK